MTESSSQSIQARPPLAEELPDNGPVPAAKPSGPVRPTTTLNPRQPAANSKEVDNLLRTANLLRVRGDLAGAVSELQKAVALSPTSGQVHEMLGDLLAQAGDQSSALETYNKARALGGTPALEAKTARILVSQNRGKTSLGDETLVRGRGKLAITASALVPGMGLIMAGQVKEALIAIVGSIATASLMISVPALRAALPAPLGSGAADASPLAAVADIVLGLAVIGFYVYSLIETVRVSKPAGKDGQDD